ncbi:hypothetical protein H107_02099 [Trichophyton rubrum CBS 202.88]|nr:hypothetical protein H107_02099 [Trichophyton rubrum CBS 202.88]
MVPPELISGVLFRVEDRLDLKYLSEVSKRLNELTIPLKALEYESTTGLTSAELEDKKRWIDPEPEARFSKVVRYMELRRRVLSILIRCQEGASEQLGVINGLKAVENPKRRENSRDDGDDATNDDYFLNFDELVRWAFGPQGFPSLQMIGVGDLSDEVKPCENALLCRKSNPECEEVFPGRNYRFVT